MSDQSLPTPPSEAIRLKDLLDRLSAAATPGSWNPKPKRLVIQLADGTKAEGPVMSWLVGHTNGPDGMKVSLGSERVADHQLVAALVNAYRDGELVVRSERVPSVELLARAADLLAEEARATRDSCAGNDRDWACGDCKKDENGKCGAQRIHERLANTADELRGFA